MAGDAACVPNAKRGAHSSAPSMFDLRLLYTGWMIAKWAP